MPLSSSVMRRYFGIIAGSIFRVSVQRRWTLPAILPKYQYTTEDTDVSRKTENETLIYRNDYAQKMFIN